MKARTRKLLSLLLTLAMVVGMFVLPASAAKTVEGQVTTYTLEVGADIKESPAAYTNYVEDYFSVKGNGYSTDAKYGTGLKADGDNYTCLATLKIGAVSDGNAAAGFTGKKTIAFTTKFANAEVTVWWCDGNGSRYLKAFGVTKNEDESYTFNSELLTQDNLINGSSMPPTNGSSKTVYKTSFKVPTAGTTCVLGCNSDIYIAKVEVKETEPLEEGASVKPTLAQNGDVFEMQSGVTSVSSVNFTLAAAPAAGTTFALYNVETDGTALKSGVSASGTTLTFDSLDPAIGAGTYYIAATESGKSESARVAVTVQVYQVPATSVTIDPSDAVTFTKGGEMTKAVSITRLPENSTDDLEVTSSNPNVATWENGTLTGKDIGKTTITATAGEKTATLDVTVVGANQTASPYTFSADNLAEGTMPKGTVKYDNYFSITADGSAVNASEMAFDDFSATKRFNPGSKGKITFATTADKSTVTVWYVQNAARDFKLDSTTASSVLGSKPTAGDKAKVTFTDVASGSHTIAMDGGTEYIYKIVVTEGAGEQPGDDTLTGITVDPTRADLKVGGKQEVAVTVSPTGCTETLTVTSSNTDIATVSEIKDGKFTITANDTRAGDATITVAGATTTTVKTEIPVKVSLKKMKDAGTPQQSEVYRPGLVLTAKAKAVDAETGKDIPGVKYTYSVNGRDGNYTETVPTLNKAGKIESYFYKATATGYEPFTSTVGRNMTISKADPVLAIKAEPNRFHTAVPADRITTLTVTCDIAGADVDQVVVTGKDETTGIALPQSKIEKVEGKKGTYKVYFNEPDTKVVYVFTASFGGNENYNKAEDQTARVTVINHEIPEVTHKLTYDKNHIKITYTSAGSTDDAVLEDAGVEAEAINIPEGKEFKSWVSADLDPADKDWATQNPTKFAMPGHDVELKVEFQDKTEEPETVNKTPLVGLLRTAEKWALVPEVDTDAANVDKGVDWVEQADLDTFNAAIAKAQAVSSNAKATQADVDKAVEDLNKAIEAFQKTWKTGTKSSGSSEPATPKDYVLNDVGFTATADKEFVTAGSFQKPFDITGEVKKRTVSGTDMGFKAYEIEKDGRGSITMKLEGTSSSIKAILSSTGGSNTSQFTLKNEAGESFANAEGLTEVSGSARTTATWNNLPAGTYSLVAVKTDSNDKGMFVREITVNTIVSTTGGGDTPVVPDTAARKALKAAIDEAKKAVEAANVSENNGEDISDTEMWVTPAAKTAYESAIALAEKMADSPKFDDEALTTAKADLDAASNVFEAAKRDGKKTSSSSGGGSGSNVPSSSGGTTVKNEDGSKTTTKTNKVTGTVTETTTWPNGDKQVVVTEKDGTVTETITKKDGSKTETVTKPDGSTTTAVTDTKGIKTETAVTASGETSAKVTLPNRVDKAVVTIPVKDATDGTVAVIVDAKGNETVIKTAVADETGLKLLVTGNVSVKIKDNAKKFQDIDDGYWAKGAVDFVSSREIFKGTTDVTFSPLDLVNRGMMATVLFRLADAKAEGDNNFFDVPDGTWYTDAVTWANRSGVVTGYADGTFGPVDAVTREQMAAMLFRYAKVMGMDVTAKGDMSKFSDANDVSSWASEAMTWCVGVGLINGVADPATGTTLSPAKTASRAEVATIMQRMVKLMMQ